MSKHSFRRTGVRILELVFSDMSSRRIGRGCGGFHSIPLDHQTWILTGFSHCLSCNGERRWFSVVQQTSYTVVPLFLYRQCDTRRIALDMWLAKVGHVLPVSFARRIGGRPVGYI